MTLLNELEVTMAAVPQQVFFKFALFQFAINFNLFTSVKFSSALGVALAESVL